jgi:hypothetical protein
MSGGMNMVLAEDWLVTICEGGEPSDFPLIALYQALLTSIDG